MINPVKRASIRARDKFLSNILNRIIGIENNQKTLNQKLHEANLKINNTGIFTISDSEIVAKIFTGLKVYLDPRDISVTPHLALDGIYEGHISNAWLSLVKPTDTVVDIGANFGYFGALAAQKTDKKSSKIIYFEANPKLIPYIRKTLGANWLNEQSIVENLALSNESGKVKLHVLKDYVGSSSLHNTDELDTYMHGKMYLETREIVEVQATTLDIYCKDNGIKKVDLIKMDIEGFEEKAYQGMRDIVKASPRITLFVEFTKQSYEDSKKFYEQLLRDFGNIYLINNLGKFYTPKDTTYETVIGKEDDWVMPVFSKLNNLDFTK